MKPSGVPWLGDIPEGWDVRRLKDAFSFGKGLSITKADLTPTGVPVISYGQIHSKTNSGTHLQDALLRHVPKSFLKTDSDCLLHENDFVFADTSEDLEGLGNCVFVDRNDIIFAGYHTLVLRPKYKAHFRYLAYLFKSDVWRAQFRAKAFGIKVYSLSQRILNGCSIILPPLPEQLAIADFLDGKCAAIDAIVEEAKAGIEEYAKWKQSVVFQAVTKGLDPHAKRKDSGVEWIGEIPEEWKVVPLKRHVDMLTPMRDKPEDLSGPIPWIRIEDFEGKFISKSKDGFGVSDETISQMNLKVYPVGTVLCTSSCDLGKCAIVSTPLVSNQRFIGIIPKPSISSDFLYYLMLSNAERLNMLSTGTIQANLSRVEFERLRVQIPPLPEQRAIADYLDEKCSAIDALIEEKKQLIEDLGVYKKSLIYETVTGKRKIA